MFSFRAGGSFRSVPYSIGSLKTTPSPAHYEFQTLHFDTWKSDNPGQENNRFITKSKYPDYAAKVLYGHGGQIVYEFDDGDGLGDKMKIEMKASTIVGLKRDANKLWVELSAPPTCFTGHQDVQSGSSGLGMADYMIRHALFGLPLIRDKKQRASYTKISDNEDPSFGGQVMKSRYHNVVFNTSKRCENFTDRLVQLDPQRLKPLLASGFEVQPARKQFADEEIEAQLGKKSKQSKAASKGNKTKEMAHEAVTDRGARSGKRAAAPASDGEDSNEEDSSNGEEDDNDDDDNDEALPAQPAQTSSRATKSRAVNKPVAPKAGTKQKEEPEASADEDTACQVCGSRESADHNSMLLCDMCDHGYHQLCLQPKLKEVPEGDWFCQGCVPATSGAKKASTDNSGAKKASVVTCSGPRGMRPVYCIPVKQPKAPVQPAGASNKKAKASKVDKEAQLLSMARQRGWVGSDGTCCDGCRSTDDVDEFDVCPRCLYTTCECCLVSTSRGNCYCKDSNMGYTYPRKRDWYMTGYW